MTEKSLTQLTTADWVRHDLERDVALAAAETERFAKYVAEYGLGYAVQWSGDALIADASATLSRQVLTAADQPDATLADALGYFVADARRRLLGDSLRTESSSAISNAVSVATAKATARWAERFGAALDRLTAEEAAR
jgi:hypothetical protein